jgi:cation diffusion facilitator CzcD-associated flavoprotein CzcO
MAPDIIVTASGLNMQLLRGVPFRLDGKPVDFTQHLTSLGMMVQGIPNLATPSATSTAAGRCVPSCSATWCAACSRTCVPRATTWFCN